MLRQSGDRTDSYLENRPMPPLAKTEPGDSRSDSFGEILLPFQSFSPVSFPWISPEKSSKRTDVKNNTTQNPTFPFASKTRYLLKSKTQHNPHSLGSHCVSAFIFTVTRRTTEECCSSLSEVNSVFFCTFSSLPCTAENNVRSPLSCPAPLCSW